MPRYGLFESSQNRLGFERGAERVVEKCLNVPQGFPAVTIERKSISQNKKPKHFLCLGFTWRRRGYSKIPRIKEGNLCSNMSFSQIIN
jgi:hypothetical protein